MKRPSAVTATKERGMLARIARPLTAGAMINIRAMG
jgi:hypothetical protein